MYMSPSIICGIYLISCTVSGKVYVGSSINIRKRFSAHLSRLRATKHINHHLQNAYDLYGESAFQFSVIEECARDSLLERENYHIHAYQSFDRTKGFNQTECSRSPLGYKHDDEAKRKMSLMKKGKKQSPEAVNSRAAKLRGKKRSEETKAALSEARRGEGNPMWGTKHSEERKAQLRDWMNSVPRWNAGKTKENDPILAKMALARLGTPAANAQRSRLTDRQTGQVWEARSLSQLGQDGPLSIASLNRLRSGNAGKKLTQRYLLEHIT